MATRFRLNFEAILGIPLTALAGGTLTFDATGTTGLRTIWSNDDLSVTKLNPVTLDSAGKHGDIWLDDPSLYRVIVKDAGGSVVPGGDIDPIDGGISVIATGASSSRSLADRFSDPVNVKDYGGAVSAGYVVGSGGDDTAAFVAALAVGSSVSVYVPHGIYKVTTNQLFLGSTQKLFGDGIGSSIVKSFSTTGAILTLGGQALSQSDIDVRDIGFQFDNSVARSVGQRCIRVLNAAYFHLYRVDMLNGAVNFYGDDGTLIYSMLECKMRNGSVAMVLAPGATYNPDHNLVKIRDCQFTGSVLQAIVAEGTGNNTFHQLLFEGNDFETNGTNGSGLNVCSFTNVGKSGIGPGVTFRNNWFENNHGLRDLAMTGNNTAVTFELSGNSFFSTAVTTDNVSIATGRVFGTANGLITSGPTNNLTLAADTAGEFSTASNDIARLNNLGTVTSAWPQYTARSSTGAGSVAISGSTTPGNHTYTTQVAKRSKIGSRVRYTFSMVINTLGTIAGNIRLTSLDISVNDGFYAGGGLLTQWQGVNLPANSTQITLEVGPGATYASLVYSGDAINPGFVDATMLTAPVTLQGFLDYDTP